MIQATELVYCYQAQIEFSRSDWSNPGFEEALRLQFEAHIANIKQVTEEADRRMLLGEFYD